MHVVTRRDGQIGPLDRTEHVDDAAQVVQVLVDDRRTDVDVVVVGRTDDGEVLGYPDHFADAFHADPSRCVIRG